ncbi:hypothetical protein [Dyadobacter sp. CY356]|uniref:hypothetical protein n=1 Tax=Dyadobacter sp. CY356 TaxID=2906442 RepID=UPI001F241418|nr:hypothetical protein [Dyadobacter sp. CY356]MCF0055532.1 hypothetical protein [Dyadobacter sp. CY356]
MTNTYKEALDKFTSKRCKTIGGDYKLGWVSEDDFQTIRKALRIAHRLQQEPSEAMVNKAEEMDFIYHRTTDNPEAVFKAMTEQLMKECGGAS